MFKDITPLLADAGRVRGGDRRDGRAVRATPASRTSWRSRAAASSSAARSRSSSAPASFRCESRASCRATTRREEYALEYGTDALEIHADACGDGARVLIVDDVLATGGTAAATCRLVESLGATVVGFSFLMALTFLSGAERLAADGELDSHVLSRMLATAISQRRRANFKVPGRGVGLAAGRDSGDAPVAQMDRAAVS